MKKTYNPSWYPTTKLTIVGGGIIGAMEAYFAYMQAKMEGKLIRITVLEKNPKISDTTTCNIAPSLSPDEIFALPRSTELLKMLEVKFDEPGGMRVDDVQDVNDSLAKKRFIAKLKDNEAAKDDNSLRSQTLLDMGVVSMRLWQKIYTLADQELKSILENSNFTPCQELEAADQVLNAGYRVNIIQEEDAALKARTREIKYFELGYKHSKVLTPDEVVALNPYLHDFCTANSSISELGELVWNTDTAATFVPGGCLDVEVFLPKFYAYLTKVSGQYINDQGVIKNCFRLKLQRYVEDIVYVAEYIDPVISALQVNGKYKFDKHEYAASDYVFCPGENVGTLTALGLDEPAAAGFAGASLKLNIPIPENCELDYKNLHNCMSVTFPDAGVAWQARVRDGKIFIGVGGTKAFYADQAPHIDQEFASKKNLAQLNVINALLPQFVSLAFGRDTHGLKLKAEDLSTLEQNGIAQRWVGRRALAYDGFPTLGHAYIGGDAIANARCTTHLGSGGVSFAPAAVLFSRAVSETETGNDATIQQAIKFGLASR